MALFTNYAAYLKAITRGNELTNNSYRVLTEAKWKLMEKLNADAERYSAHLGG